MKDEKEFLEALSTKKVPILVLDQKWHRLFALSGKTDIINELERKVNELLERNGKLNTDIKDLKKTKKTLMGNIVNNMEGTYEENTDPVIAKKLAEDRRLIDEINVKIEACEDELMELPRTLDAANKELMIASMDYCYEKLRENSSEIDDISAWITQVRIDLKKNIIKKQNREINNKQMYAYMHDVFGPSVLDLFDLKQEDEERFQGIRVSANENAEALSKSQDASNTNRD